MLKVEIVLLEKMYSNISTNELKEWIGQNLGTELTNSVDFIQSLVTWFVFCLNLKSFSNFIFIISSVIKNAAEKTLIVETRDINMKHDKQTINKQKILIENYKNLLQEYLLNSTISK